MQQNRPPTHSSEMTAAWSLWFAMLTPLAVYLLIVLEPGERLKPAPEASIIVRTLFYAIAIVAFPVMNWLRRLMLGRNRSANAAVQAETDRHIFGRYLGALAVSLALAEGIGILGLTLFVLGDSRQTFTIFLFLSALAMVLYRPKREEYRRFCLTRKRM